MHISKFVLALLAASVLATGCAKQRAPATKAVEAIETSLAEVKSDAAKYAPDGLKGVESQLARLKASLDAKEYDNVLAGTPQLEKAVASLKDAVASGKEHARAALASAKTEWSTLSVEVPKMIENIQARVDELSKRKIRIKVSKEEVESAKTSLEWMKTELAEATSAANSGSITAAAEKANAVKAKGQELQKTLGMKDSSELTASKE
jgi:predicted  nucleic acid-binding Zn-ribbon protein